MKLGVVILAAGASTRMGRPKLLLPWGTGTVLGHLLEQWKQLAPRQTAIVTAPANAPLNAELDRLHWPGSQRLVNPSPEQGMFSSVQCAARWPGWQQDLTHWAIALGDQPLVRLETLRQVLAFAAQQPEAICQPSRKGRGRHPVLLPVPVFAQLKSARAETLKEFLTNCGAPTVRFESDDAGLDLDLDLPADYHRALALAG